MALATPLAAATPQQTLQQYETAIRQQNLTAVEALLTDDLIIQLVLTPPGEEAITISLTRAEFLQHLRTLWSFSSAHILKIEKVRVEQPQGNRTRVQFHQQEHYTLFGEDLHQVSDILIELRDEDDSTKVGALTVTTEGW